MRYKKIECLIKTRRSLIGCTDANLEKLKKGIDKCETKLNDETVWTFLAVLPYLSVTDGLNNLFKVLTGSGASTTIEKLWLEALPYPPRESESNTHLDLALGGITDRNGTKNGIKYCPNFGKQVCFCEMKWESDISTSVANNLHRNQIARVIDNLISFQDDGQNRPEKFYFTLVTPSVFVQGKGPYSRLYGYKIKEYSNQNTGLQSLQSDLSSNLKVRGTADWKYPDQYTRNAILKKLVVKHVSYEAIINNAPDSDAKQEAYGLLNRGFQEIKRKS